MTAVPSHRLTSELGDLTREIVLELPQAPEPLIDHYIKRSIIRFCEISHFWHETLGAINFDAEVSAYDISAGKYLEILDIKRVEVGETEIRQNRKDMGVLARWTQRSADTIDLFGLEAGDTVDITVSVKPIEVDGIIKVSQSVLRDYRDTILDGARAGLYRIPKKEWTDLTQFQLCEQRFIAGSEEAGRRQANNFSRVAKYTNQPRDFF